MAIFESLEHTTDTAIKKSEAFLKNSEAYYRLKVFQMATSSISMLVKLAVVGLFLLIAFIFIAVGLSNLIGNYLGNDALAYFLVALIYVLFAVIAYMLRGAIESLIIKNLSNIFFEDEDDI
ncbi:hypothetical protein [Tenacibaculum sp. IB213877]|uniref:hypothetical protein n=1 Tax=Tenacibaculum sp. IB213877 TaxID=3097351 RepID=UPI002A5A8A05|nr:hypothetical protein [Tenacibaculum sp. IB213877]MDY0780124.1 hypothetical protein [Tenacibaculum sp. IB213877]